MMRRLLTLLAFFAAVPAFPTGEISVRIDIFRPWKEERDKLALVSNEQNFVHLCSLNSGALLFDRYPKTWVYAINTQVNSFGEASATIPDSLLRVISNNLSCKFRVQRINHSIEEAPALQLSEFRVGFVLNPHSSFPKILPEPQFRANELNPGFKVYQGALGPIDLTLDVASPNDFARLGSLKGEIASLEKELKALNERELKTAELERELNRYRELAISDLPVEELERLTTELSGTAHVVREFKTSIETTRLTIDSHIAETTRSLDELRARFELAGQADLDAQLETLYRKYSLEELVLPSSAVPELIKSEALFNERDNAYAFLSQETIRRLEGAIANGSREEFNALVEAWSQNHRALERSHRLAGSEITNAEHAAFERASRDVVSFITSKIDDFGFFLDAPIPSDVKELIKIDLAARDIHRARALRDALNEWHPHKELTKEQKILLDLVRALGAGYRSAREAGEGLASTVAKLDGFFDDVIDSARTAARIGVAFTPANDLVDFCEMATGIEGCLPGGRQMSTAERVVSAGGLLIGTGAFWRKFGKIFKGRGAAKVAEETGDIVEIWLKRVDKAPLPLALSAAIRDDLKLLAKYDPERIHFAMTVRPFAPDIEKRAALGTPLAIGDPNWGKVFQPGRWIEHRETHAKEFFKPDGTAQQYLDLARDFLQNREHLEWRRRPGDGTLLFIGNKRVAMVDSDGVISTFHRVDGRNKMNVLRQRFPELVKAPPP